MIATQNAGADTPTIESTITTVSMPFPLLTAAKIPHGIPMTEAKIKDMHASFTVTLKQRISASVTTSLVK